MTGWAARRFWHETGTAEGPEGFSVTLDARPIRTPAKTLLALPTRALAEALAAEWAAQDEAIRPETMPLTRLANSALDQVAPQHAAVADIVAAYGETDLLCYRADAPEELARRQAAAWDPLLEWACERYGAGLATTTGVVPILQPEAALARLRAAVAATTPWELAALHEFVSHTGSLVLGLALLEGASDPDTAWRISRLDEDWQITQWGRDDEAEAALAHRRAEFDAAVRFLNCLQSVA